MNKPSIQYQAMVHDDRIVKDSSQEALLDLLDTCHAQLTCRYFLGRRHKGLYVWGEVGIGKSMLLAMFYDGLPLKKERLHFHAFMHQVHGSLTALAGQKDPLPALAKAWAQRIQVLYLDELVVADIADAMMIENLFRALVACGIFLIISANRRPDQLYLGGVNHAAFLPAIAWMEAHLTIYHLASKYDYRSGMTLGAGAFLTPISAESEQRMQKMFSGWAKGAGMTHEIMVCDRTFPVKLRSDTVLWVDFDVICSPPRSQDDYLELVKTYRYWLVSSVPKLEQNDQITLLIKLIDLLYEAHVPLVMEAVGPLEAIAPEGALAFRFQRTRSRIQYLTS